MIYTFCNADEIFLFSKQAYTSTVANVQRYFDRLNIKELK